MVKLTLNTTGKSAPLVAKPLSSIQPTAPAPTMPAKVEPAKIVVPSPKVMPKLLGSESLAAMAKAITKSPSTEGTRDIDKDILLDNMDEAFSPLNDLRLKLEQIEKLMSMEDIPIKALKVGCDSIMKDLKASPDTTLELEPEEIKLIVQGYLKAADAETTRILEKAKPKKAKKPALTQKAQAALELAKQLNFDGIEENF